MSVTEHELRVQMEELFETMPTHENGRLEKYEVREFCIAM